jgi:hypothetical protein
MWKKVGMVLGILLTFFISDFFLSWSRMVVSVTGDALAWKSAYLAGRRASIADVLEYGKDPQKQLIVL